MANHVPGAVARVAQAEEKLERAMEAVLEAESSCIELDESSVDDESDENENSVVEDIDQSRVFVDKTVKEPINFSRIDTRRPIADIAKEFPKFLEACAAFCNVEAGDMLYLPASWFHEVTSYSSSSTKKEGLSPSSSSSSSTTCHDDVDVDSGHLALNYWYHPPDTATFATPYSSPFWPRDFAARSKR